MSDHAADLDALAACQTLGDVRAFEDRMLAHHEAHAEEVRATRPTYARALENWAAVDHRLGTDRDHYTGEPLHPLRHSPPCDGCGTRGPLNAARRCADGCQ